MQNRLFITSVLMCVCVVSFAQTTYLNIGTDNYWMLDRMQTRTGRMCDSLFLDAKQESRRNAVWFLEMLKEKQDSGKRHMFSRIDKYNIDQMISESGEWTQDENGAISSKRRLFNYFYKTQYNLSYLKTKDFFLIINPVINYTRFSDNNTPKFSGARTSGYYQSHDGEIRGWIAKKLGFYMYFTANGERLPGYVYDYAVKSNTSPPRVGVPGVAYVKPANPSRDSSFSYYLANGYIDFAPIKDRLNITFGSGKNFLGDGMSSLFLTDFSGNMPYLKVRARIWKVNYETIYLELTGQHKRAGDFITTKKFATMHYISTNVARWLNLSFFEGVVFDRPNSYELSYLNPVALLITTNHFNGAGDKSIIGFAGKMFLAKHFQLYGQMVLNEFRTKEIIGGKNWYGNKYGILAGAKYFDVFGIRNLDAQAELHAVRPYTYSAKDTLGNYTNYNQPLADPLGSGFVKFTTLIRLQPTRNLTLSMKYMAYRHGVDTGNSNYGNNIFVPYTNPTKEYGVGWINGPQAVVSSLNFNLSWQFRRNLYLDFGTIARTYTNDKRAYPNYSTVGTAYSDLQTNMVYFGIRVNAVRRDYTFF